MMHLAQKTGMNVEYAYGDADAYLTLPPANPGTIVEEAVNEQWADFDYALKENWKRSNEAWWWFLGRPTLAFNYSASHLQDQAHLLRIFQNKTDSQRSLFYCNY